MINYDELTGRDFADVQRGYAEDDCTLYDLGLDLREPEDKRHLRAVYEGSYAFAALPSFVKFLGNTPFWAQDPSTGIAWQKIVHKEHEFTLHTSLPITAGMVGRPRLNGLVDKSAGKGALIYIEHQVSSAGGIHLVTFSSTLFARDDGDFGGLQGPLKPVHTLPDRAPDTLYDFAISLRCALIYRLSGDMNPPHVDLTIAVKVGFKRPILHWLYTLGIAAWSIPMALRDSDFAALTHQLVRFAAPAEPGETVHREIWTDSDDISFRARVFERDAIAFTHGLARLN